MIPDYYVEKIRNPTYAILVNGKEQKRLPFLKQALKYKQTHESNLWGVHIEIINTETGEIINC